MGESDMTSQEVKVWDPLVRIFHWSLVLFFSIAYITEDDFLTLHEYSGYVVLALVCFRIIWGFIGSRFARFSDFIYRPSTVIQYLKDTLSMKAPRMLGHNPVGGYMIIALLVFLLLTSLTGFVAYEEGDMPAYMSNLTEEQAELFEELHEGLANFTLLLVFVHIIGVVLVSIVHGENLIRAMFTGRKKSL